MMQERICFEFVTRFAWVFSFSKLLNVALILGHSPDFSGAILFLYGNTGHRIS